MLDKEKLKLAGAYEHGYMDGYSAALKAIRYQLTDIEFAFNEVAKSKKSKKK